VWLPPVLQADHRREEDTSLRFGAFSAHSLNLPPLSRLFYVPAIAQLPLYVF
jgi:hypothetical protein